ncbi:hypothetical protein JTB14_011691 [Gonioctena quinquepunctata]|nr:hypothetical protein JTB14_011691 [Gonioctena quinquepunctata]
MDRDIYRGLTVILENKSDLSRKADEVNELFKIYKVKTGEAISYMNRLSKYNKVEGDSLLREFVSKWGAIWKIKMEDPLSSPDDTSKEEEEKMDETCIVNVEVSNQFQALADPTMDKQQGTSITKDTYRLKPPPIIIKDKKNWPAISQLLRNSNLKSDKDSNDKDGIEMTFSEMGTYEKCLQTLGHHKIDHFTFNKKSGNEIRAIFEGVAEDFAIEDITNDLKSKGFHPIVVARFKN